MSTPPRQPTEEELRAAYEAELKKLRVEDVLLQTIVSLVNLGGGQAGLAPGTEDERDPDQLHKAIEGARALLPLLESRHAEQLGPVRDTLARLQMEERTYGWPSEMIIKAVRCGVPIREVPVRYRRRHGGQSKVSGTWRGTLGASYRILKVTYRYARSRRRSWTGPDSAAPRRGA